MVSRSKTVVAAIVGIDGCGKSSTFNDALTQLASESAVAGVGDQVLFGSPGSPVSERTGVPLSRSARVVGGVAKQLRSQRLYKQLKLFELSERSHIADYLGSHDAPAVILTDGDPLTNVTAWSVARYYREWLADDHELADVIEYTAGERRILLSRIPRYARRAWQLVLINRLHLARMRVPDIVFLLQISPERAMERIRARGKALQAHETEAFLAELARAYERVCRLLAERFGVRVVRVNVDELAHPEAVALVTAAIREQVSSATSRPAISGAPGIDVIATTMSGSIKDQRKLGQIGPEFEKRTSLPVRVHLADSHAEARELAHQVVSAGGRTLVSAGGAGTFNAVLEGAHIDGRVPGDLRLAFLRKGSADLIGKALHIPDTLPEAVSAIVAGLDADNLVGADILEVSAVDTEGNLQVRHMVGFGGLGVFGEVPRFTETRIIKYYKGVLGTLFGDLGPFYTGLALAGVYWRIQRLLGRVPPLVLRLDGEELPPQVWGAVTIVNGDLGHDFPLGRGLEFASRSFRVVGLRYEGIAKAVKQVNAVRTGRVLDEPTRYGALVREVHSLRAEPARTCPPFMVNVDGLRMTSTGEVNVTIAGTVNLVDGATAAPSPETAERAKTPAAV